MLSNGDFTNTCRKYFQRNQETVQITTPCRRETSIVGRGKGRIRSHKERAWILVICMYGDNIPCYAHN